jgi:hypothetical protein
MLNHFGLSKRKSCRRLKLGETCALQTQCRLVNVVWGLHDCECIFPNPSHFHVPKNVLECSQRPRNSSARDASLKAPPSLVRSPGISQCCPWDRGSIRAGRQLHHRQICIVAAQQAEGVVRIDDQLDVIEAPQKEKPKRSMGTKNDQKDVRK